MVILGIETSCDETAVGIVRDGSELLVSSVYSQIKTQMAYGGVVPEIAARSHIEVMLPVLQEALDTAKLDWGGIDGLAVTYGPGLIGSLFIGLLTARTLAITQNLPLYAVDHVESHVYANFLTSYPDWLPFPPPKEQPRFPMLALIVSGGHSQLVLFRDHFDYDLLGQTQDDAIGEAYDKVAKILGLPYPGGPSVSKAAEQGDPNAYTYPKARLSGKYDFSFSGPKTAVLRHVQRLVNKPIDFPSHLLAPLLSEKQRSDVAASFQRVAIETVADKALAAYDEYRPASVVIAGGVAANSELRRYLAQKLPIEINYAAPPLCTDNGAMIATLGCFRALRKTQPDDPYTLRAEPSLSM